MPRVSSSMFKMQADFEDAALMKEAQKHTALLGPRLSARCRPDLWLTDKAWAKRSLARQEPVDTKNNDI